MSDDLLSQATQTTDGAATPGTADAGNGEGTNANGQNAPTPQGGNDAGSAESQSTEPKPGEDGTPSEPVGAPEKYEFAAPEGYALDDKVVAQFSEVAKELNLTQEAAQKVVEKVAPAIADQQRQAFEQIKSDWAESTKADKEIGGDKLNETLATAKSALDKFATPEFKQLLEQSGFGNNPEVIRVFARIGAATSSDTKLVTGAATTSKGGGTAAERAAASFYKTKP